MVRPLLIVVSGLVLAASSPAFAELYRCLGENGALRFVDRPDACEGAEPFVLKDGISGAREEPSRSENTPFPASPAPVARDLEALLLSAQHTGPGWDIVPEAAIDISDDLDFISWGVIEKLARHYARQSRGLTQVCSIELWRFSSVAAARVAAENISYPQWQIDREDEMLIMIHGLSHGVENIQRRGVFPDCNRLGGIQRRRLADAALIGR